MQSTASSLFGVAEQGDRSAAEALFAALYSDCTGSRVANSRGKAVPSASVRQRSRRTLTWTWPRKMDIVGWQPCTKRIPS